MKKYLILCVLCAFSLVASAKISQMSLNNINGTNIVLMDDAPSHKYDVTQAYFLNDGKKYKAKKIKWKMKDGKAFIQLQFKTCHSFYNCSVELVVNGKREKVEINMR